MSDIQVKNDDGTVTKGEFIERKNGWTSYYDNNGVVRKTRNSNIINQPKETPMQPAEAQNNTAEVAPASPQHKSTDNLRDARLRYHREKIGSGKEARLLIDCDDEVARALRGSELSAVYDLVASRTGKSVEELKEKYSHLNTGMQRMTLSNILRGLNRPKKGPTPEERAAEKARKAEERERAAKARADERERLAAEKKAQREAEIAEKAAKKAAEKAEKERVKEEQRQAKAAEKAAAKEAKEAAKAAPAAE